MREHNAWPVLVGQVLVPPLQQPGEHRIEIEALLGQPVFISLALPRLLVRNPAQDSVLDEVGQARAQHLARGAGVLLDVVEPADPAEGFAQHEDGPALAEEVHGPGDGAVGRAVTDRYRAVHISHAKSS